MLPPEIIAVHLGQTPAQRLRCKARLFKTRYIPDPPTPVATLADLRLSPGTLTVFGAPIGLSEAYADLAKLTSFREALGSFGKGRFERFYEIASTPQQVAVERPFYPMVAHSCTKDTQKEILGEAAFALRQCELRIGANPLFWLAGPDQPGRAAIPLWQQILGPRLDQIALWPFDGPLEELLASNKPVVAEIHPQLIQHRLGLDILIHFSRMPRASSGMQIYEQVKNIDFQNVRKTLLYGQGPSPSGDAEFDVLVSLIGVAHLFLQNKFTEPPEPLRRMEGWMLGL